MGEQMKSLLDGLNEAKAKIKKMRAKYLAEVKANFTKVADEVLFSKYADLQSFGWHQYTPYFNDGEECEFSVHSGDPYINGVSEMYDWDEEETEEMNENGIVNILENSQKQIWDNGYKDNPNYDPNADEIVKSVRAFIGLFDEDDLKYLFGDHAHVTVNREEVIIDRADHD